MRAFALTSSRLFSALILLLSLGPLAVNVVSVLCHLRDINVHSQNVIHAHSQAWLAFGLRGYVDPVFGCMVVDLAPSAQVYIG